MVGSWQVQVSTLAARVAQRLSYFRNAADHRFNILHHARNIVDSGPLFSTMALVVLCVGIVRRRIEDRSAWRLRNQFVQRKGFFFLIRSFQIEYQL
jgi:hypothetical protein